MDTVSELAKKMLDEGKCVVVGLQSTGLALCYISSSHILLKQGVGLSKIACDYTDLATIVNRLVALQPASCIAAPCDDTCCSLITACKPVYLINLKIKSML